MALITDRPVAPREDRFQVTRRVLAILSSTARYGVLTSDQIARLDGGSRQKVTRILQRCVENKLLKKLGSSHDVLLTSFFDARPRCFGITQRGLRALADAGAPIEVPAKRATVQLAHEIETAEAMFMLNAAVAAHGGVRLIDQPELLAAGVPSATREMAKPLRLKTDVHPHDYPHLGAMLKVPITLFTEPDRLFALQLPDNTGWSFALELCRSTEDIFARRLKGKTTHLKKVLGYFSAWRSSTHLQQWGELCKALRVLTVTTSDTRIHHMIEAQEHVTRGAAAGLFLYSTAERLKTVGALGPAWVSAKRNDISLLDRE